MCWCLSVGLLTLKQVRIAFVFLEQIRDGV